MKTAIIAGVLAAFTEAILWWTFNQYGRISFGCGGSNALGELGFLFHLPAFTFGVNGRIEGTIERPITMNSIQTPSNSQSHTRKMAGRAAVILLLIATSVGVTVGFVSRAAQTDKTATPGSSRYQISAFGNTSGHGAYVLDTWTGEVWLVGESISPKKVADKLKQESAVFEIISVSDLCANVLTDRLLTRAALGL